MVDIATAANLFIQAQNVALLAGASAGGSTTGDQVFAVRQANIEATLPEVRTNHGVNRIYNYGKPDIALYFISSAYTDLLTYIATRSRQNARNIPVQYEWAFRATGNDGTTRTMTFTGNLMHWNFVAPIEQQGEPSDVEVRIRIVDDTITVV